MNRESRPPQGGFSKPAPVIGFGPGGQQRGPGGPMGARLNAEKPKQVKKTVSLLGNILFFSNR